MNYFMAYARRRAASGLCNRCGGENDSEYLECDPCRETRKGYKRNWRAAKGPLPEKHTTSKNCACKWCEYGREGPRCARCGLQGHTFENCDMNHMLCAIALSRTETDDI